MPSDIYQEIAKAVPVLIGGALAILGGLVGQALTHHLTAKREKQTHLRSRIESLVKSLYAHSQWLDDRFNSMVIRNEDHNEPSPLDEAKMLQSLYFPELAPEIYEVMKAQVPMIQFIWEQRLERMKDQAAWLKSFDREPYNEMYKAHLVALNNATKKSRTLLEKRLAS
jgi:hypothetical protein